MSRKSDYRKLRERRTIASTIGYCFVIVLIVLLVMSSNLTGVYTTVLESERAEAMESIAVASSAALGHTPINEGMTYPLEIYEYAKGKPYIIDIYTKAGNSFLRLYTSSDYDDIDQYYLSGVGDVYNTCFEQQVEAFTKRTDDGVDYVCAIAPIISSENTVAGILEVRMPYSDYVSTVNGMSLSWIFTIFSIAVSMGIIIFEINLFVSTLSKGISGNVPVLIMYGDNAPRFLSFFMALGAIMPPIVLADFIKRNCSELNIYAINSIIAAGLILYAIGFFSFSGLRKQLKFKLTGRIALLVMTAIGCILSLLAGITDNAIVLLILTMPVGFCFGMSFDSLRDYRINAGKLGYDEFNDRAIHNIQSTGYFLGISVGTVIAGIAFERFGLLIVNIICSAALMLAALGIVYFMKDNTPVRESYMPVNKWLELVSDKHTGRFLNSTFFVMGITVSFLLGFIPNYLETVGISLATSSFYYLVAAFAACFAGTIIKNRYAYILTSKIRVIISSACSCIGLLLFSLMPTAKILVLTTFFLGMSLGIHDYYYLYVLFLLASKRFKANLRKAAEMSFFAGLIIAVPILAVALMINIRIVIAISMILYFIMAFMYPASSFSNEVDDKDPSLKQERPHATGPRKKASEHSSKTQAYAEPQAPQQPLEQQAPETYAQDSFGYDQNYVPYDPAPDVILEADPQQEQWQQPYDPQYDPYAAPAPDQQYYQQNYQQGYGQQYPYNDPNGGYTEGGDY